MDHHRSVEPFDEADLVAFRAEEEGPDASYFMDVNRMLVAVDRDDKTTVPAMDLDVSCPSARLNRYAHERSPSTRASAFQPVGGSEGCFAVVGLGFPARRRSESEVANRPAW